MADSDELQVDLRFRPGPLTFAVVQGATYKAFVFRITITEVHSDYLAVAINKL
jgi:hypothetical protein